MTTEKQIIVKHLEMSMSTLQILKMLKRDHLNETKGKDYKDI